MRRNLLRRIPPRYLAAAAGALVLALILSIMVGRLGSSPEGVSPGQLARIQARNHAAATDAAAVQRAQSAASAEASDRATDLQDAQARGAAEADATLARFNEDNLTAPPTR